MRELTAGELEFISGGLSLDDEEVIIVTGSPPSSGFPPTSWPSPPPLSPSPAPSGGGGGSGGAAPSYSAETYRTDFKCPDGAAVGIAGEMKKLLQAPSADAEYGAYIIKNADGTFGAYSDTIRTSYMSSYVNMGTLPPATDLAHMSGIVNCVTWNSSDYWANFTYRYPDPQDWLSLDKMVAAGANPANLSIYVLDGFGDVHEFHYTDKAALNALTENQRRNGAMLSSPTPCS